MKVLGAEFLEADSEVCIAGGGLKEHAQLCVSKVALGLVELYSVRIGNLFNDSTSAVINI